MFCDFAMKKRTEQKFLTSKEAKATLKVQDCDLAHIRNEGKLKFTKKRNAFFYDKKSIDKFLKKNA
jgi:hypothetical protein